MRIRLALCLAVAWLLFPPCPQAQEAAPRSLLRDDAAGYVLPLPSGWREITDAGQLAEVAGRVCAVFMRGNSIPGASRMRGAILPDSAPASPALVVFVLDHAAALGLDVQSVQNIAKDARKILAPLANALQESYKQMYPASIMINSQLGDDFFALNLRSVLDFADEAASTRNRRIKVMLTAAGAVVLTTQYDGPLDAERDAAIAASVREMIVLPEKNLQSVIPPYQASFLDYALLCAAILFVVILVRRARR